jgi:hypothetical protein
MAWAAVPRQGVVQLILVQFCSHDYSPCAWGALRQVHLLGLLSMALDAFTLLVASTALLSVAMSCPSDPKSQQVRIREAAAPHSAVWRLTAGTLR